MLDEYEKRRERLKSALEIGEREWGNVRKSLELCGDAGDFHREDFMVGIIDEDVIIRQPAHSPTKGVSGYSPTFYPMYFVANLLAMDEKMAQRGYRTVEALYVFIELVTKASEKLGLSGTFCMGFATGYAYCRTGWPAEKTFPLERDLFYEMFFPRDLFLFGRGDYTWDFHWTSVQERLNCIFEKFMQWQKDPELYNTEVKSKSKVIPMMV